MGRKHWSPFLASRQPHCVDQLHESRNKTSWHFAQNNPALWRQIEQQPFLAQSTQKVNVPQQSKLFRRAWRKFGKEGVQTLLVSVAWQILRMRNCPSCRVKIFRNLTYFRFRSVNFFYFLHVNFEQLCACCTKMQNKFCQREKKLTVNSKSKAPVSQLVNADDTSVITWASHRETKLKIALRYYYYFFSSFSHKSPSGPSCSKAG